MNYYNEIKNDLINIEITKRIKDYSKNKVILLLIIMLENYLVKLVNIMVKVLLRISL